MLGRTWGGEIFTSVMLEYVMLYLSHLSNETMESLYRKYKEFP